MLLRPSLDLGVCFGQLAFDEQFRTGGASMVGCELDQFTSAQRAVARFNGDVLVYRFGMYPVYVEALGAVASFEPWRELLSNGDIPSRLHWGTGAGIRTNTPIGPVQLTLGWRDLLGKPPVHDAQMAIFITVGREFRCTQ